MNNTISKKLISIVTPCFNEEDNVNELYKRICKVMEASPYDYEHIFIDNASTDSTVQKVKTLAKHDSRVKLIVNAVYLIVKLFPFCKKFKTLIHILGDCCVKLVSQ